MRLHPQRSRRPRASKKPKTSEGTPITGSTLSTTTSTAGAAAQLEASLNDQKDKEQSRSGSSDADSSSDIDGPGLNFSATPNASTRLATLAAAAHAVEDLAHGVDEVGEDPSEENEQLMGMIASPDNDSDDSLLGMMASPVAGPHRF